MGLRINQNTMAMTSHRNLSINDTMLSKSLEKLSSGYRVNRASDDASGLAKSENLRREVRGTDQAIRNAEDGISYVQTAEGALNEVHAILQRMNELAVSAANTATSDGTNEQAEIAELLEQIDAIGTQTKFSGRTVFADADVTFHVGSSSGETITVNPGELSSTSVGGNADVDPVDLSEIDVSSDAGDADAAIDTIADAIEAVSTARAELGAKQNRLEHTISNLQVSSENLAASESRIRDTDIAAEMVQFTRHQIMVQTATAMLAQANTNPQSVLQLVR